MGYIQRFQNLPEFASEQQIHEWVNELRQMLIMDKSEAEIQEWYDNLWKIYGPQFAGYNECPHQLTLYTADENVQLPIQGTVDQNRLGCFDPSCPK